MQYAFLSGRSGGQTLIGGTASGDDLILQTTSDVTKGDYRFSELTTANGLLRTDGSGNVTSSVTLPDGTLATTQTPLDNSTKVATTAYVDAAITVEDLWDRTGTILDPKTDGDSVKIKNGADSFLNIVPYTDRVEFFVGADTNDIKFNTAGESVNWSLFNNVSSTPILHMDGTSGNGNLGINTASPTAGFIMDVVGNLRVSADIGDTSNRVSKGWLVNLESTNYPIVNGTALTNQYLSTTDTPTFGNLTIGTGAVGVDYTLTFDGESSDGVITWNEDLRTFEFDSYVFEMTSIGAAATWRLIANNNLSSSFEFIGYATTGQLDFGPNWTSFTFNKVSQDIDIIFEGLTDANLLYIDAGNDRIGIGTATPSSKLEVVAGSDTVIAEFTSTSAGNISTLNVINDATAAVNNEASIDLKCETSIQSRTAGRWSSSFNNTTDATRNSRTDLWHAVGGSFQSVLNINGEDLQLQNGTGINEFSIDGTLADDSDDAVPTEKAVKTYIDNRTPGKDILFIARNSGTLTDVTGDGTSYTFIANTEDIDVGSDYNTTTGIFTAPATGVYEFECLLKLQDVSSSHSRGIVRLVTTSATLVLFDLDFGNITTSSENMSTNGSVKVFPIFPNKLF